MTRGDYIFAALILLLYLGLSVPVALAKIPSDDEAWFASPALNLSGEGHMGTTVKAPTDLLWLRMDEHTYWQPPMHFLAQAGWYSIFGFSLFIERSLSIFWGVIALFCTFVFARRLSGSKIASILAVAILAIDFHFINSATDGRMDMMCVALALAGYASYLSLRAKNLSWAMFAGNSFIVLSGLTHAHGIVHLIGFVTLALFLDLKKIRLKHVLIALIPYIAGAIGWGLYILQDPEAFRVQFLGHVGRKLWSDEWGFLGGLRQELVRRYLFGYGIHSSGSLLTRLKIFVLLGYLLGVVVFILSGRKSRRSGQPLPLILLAEYFLLQSFIIEEKSPYYLVHILPLFAIIAGTALVRSWNDSTGRKILISAMLIVFALLQIGVSVRVVARNDYQNRYMPVINAIRNLDYEGKTVMGTAELAFETGFSPEFIDDPTLGYYSEREPGLIVVNNPYRRWFDRFERVEPELFTYIQRLLTEECEVVYEGPEHTIYRKTD